MSSIRSPTCGRSVPTAMRACIWGGDAGASRGGRRWLGSTGRKVVLVARGRLFGQLIAEPAAKAHGTQAAVSYKLRPGHQEAPARDRREVPFAHSRGN